MANSHDLEKGRLADVIAAIQIMAPADRPSCSLDHWVAGLEASEELAEERHDQSPVKFAPRKKWQTRFEQHPEFFKLRLLLRWRYAEALKSEPGGENPAEAPDENELPPGKPLTPEQAGVLINTAIGLGAREVEAQRAPDKFPPLLPAIVGATAGTFGGGVIVLLLRLLQSPHTRRLFD